MTAPVRYLRAVTAARLDAEIAGHHMGNLIRTGTRGVGRCHDCGAVLIVDLTEGVSGTALRECQRNEETCRCLRPDCLECEGRMASL